MRTIQIISNPATSKWQELIQRPAMQQENAMKEVEKIFLEIREEGDEAAIRYSRKFDFLAQDTFLVTNEVLENAVSMISEELREAINIAKQNIERFHISQQEEIKKIEIAEGITCWRETRPIEKVGIYIPGGSAPLFSTVLMLAIPAKIAGCSEIILCSPPNLEGNIHPAILYTAHLLGITKVFALGGIQAIGAMTFGTATVPKVDKLFGPGNQYVMAAKQMATFYGTAIDMPAGPSEVLIVADKTCKPQFVAADLLSQAEHGVDSQVILLSNSNKIVEEVNDELASQLSSLPRMAIAEKALENSKAIVFDTIEECIRFSNEYAPEHLILAIEKPMKYSQQVLNAGSVFIGNYSCESAGDYASGTNHTLPTSAYSKAYSGVSLDSFVKKITFQNLTKEGLGHIGKAIEVMAEAEGLWAHKNAVSLRLREISKKAKNEEN